MIMKQQEVQQQANPSLNAVRSAVRVVVAFKHVQPDYVEDVAQIAAT